MARIWASQHVCAALQCRAVLRLCVHPLLRLSCACPSFCECDANASLVRLDMRCFEEHSGLPDGSGKCRRRAPMPCCPWHPINVAQPRWCRFAPAAGFPGLVGKHTQAQADRQRKGGCPRIAYTHATLFCLRWGGAGKPRQGRARCRCAFGIVLATQRADQVAGKANGRRLATQLTSR